jgi:cytochrome c556
MRRAMLAGATAVTLAAMAGCNRGETPVTGNDGAAQAGNDGTVAGTIRARQANYKDMARASKAIGDQLKARNPSIADIRSNAQRLADHAPGILTWFPEGSGPESGVRTRAKAEIWTDQQGFGEAAARFIATAQEFSTTAAIGDIAAIRAAQADLGPACRNCHDRFRAPEEE